MTVEETSPVEFSTASFLKPVLKRTAQKERNAEIVQLRKNGVPVRRLVEHFQITGSAIRVIIARDKEHSHREKAAARLRVAIARKNDINHKWDTKRLIDSLLLQTRMRNALVDCALKHGRERMSLRDFLNMMILPEAPLDGKTYWMLAAYWISGIAEKGIRTLFDKLSSVNWGEAFRSEWERRLALLIQVRGRLPWRN